MQAFRTTIHVVAPIPKEWRRKPFMQFVQWHVDNLEKTEKEPTAEDLRRRNLFRILKDLQTQQFTEATEKLFKDAKLNPPYGFTQVKLSRAAVNATDSDEFIISGIGDPQPLIDWLKTNKFDIEVQHFSF